MAVLADEVGFVTSAIYRHFSNKDQVLDAVLDFLEEGLLGNANRARKETEDPLEQLRLLLFLHMQLVLEHRALPRILFSEEIHGGHPRRKARLHGIIMEYLSQVGSMIRLGQKHGIIRPELNDRTLSVLFLGLLQPSVILWHLSDGEFDIRSHLEGAWPVFVDAISVKSQPSRGITFVVDDMTHAK